MGFVTLVLCALLGGILVISALSKFLAAGEFVESISNYPFVRGPVIGLTAFAVPWFELGLGFMLLIGISLRVAALGTIALVGAFTIAIGAAILQGRRGKRCGCGSRGLASDIGWAAVKRNGVLIGIALSIAVIAHRPLALDSLAPSAVMDHPLPLVFAAVVIVSLLTIEAIIVARRSRSVGFEGISLEGAKEEPWSSEIVFADARS